MGLSRRVVIISSGVLGAAAGIGGWAVLADNRIVPGRHVVDQALGRCDITEPPLPTGAGRVVEGSFFSQHRRRSVGYTLTFPPTVSPEPRYRVCLALHGHGQDQHAAVDIGYPRLLAAAIAAGTPPFVLASVAGGNGYWHPHESGDDPLGLLLEDFPTVLAQHGLRTDKFAALGWSMGGYGALLAALESRGAVVAVAASAPAFWRSYDEARAVNAEAFDSTAEWQHWGDLLHRADALPDIPVRIDIGESDSFTPAVKALGAELPRPGLVHLAKGCHDNAFWRTAAPAQLRLIGDALAALDKR